MSSRAADGRGDIDAVMEVSRALVAIVARSFAESRVQISLQQWRVLVVIGDFGPMTVGGLARWMDVHSSTATRVSDSLVRSKLLDRRADPEDRRRTTLTLTRKGRSLVESLLDSRRQAIAAILEELPPSRRAQLGRAMRDFADVAGDHPEHFVSTHVQPASRRVDA
ncbi:MAG: MarR family transcriptional regulator [Nocardioidaceae bacterium]|nr:MarR family transcriptional regulator [Nocardioidaceae bacterium]NUS49707.1 MarR family transcriptional regulator [Nocardioidaceae bacterium]